MTGIINKIGASSGAIGTISGEVQKGITSMQAFTATGTYTKPAGINTIKVYITGGGGGGGSSQSGYGRSWGAGAPAGGTAIEVLDASAITTVAVTCGAAGAAGNGTGGGGDGGTSSFGTYCSATGGEGGDSSGVMLAINMVVLEVVASAISKVKVKATPKNKATGPVYLQVEAIHSGVVVAVVLMRRPANLELWAVVEAAVLETVKLSPVVPVALVIA